MASGSYRKEKHDRQKQQLFPGILERKIAGRIREVSGMKIDILKGRYWDKGITLVDGCTPCSPGCDHCWSATQAHRFKREGEPGHDSGILTNSNGRFNGDVIVYPERLSRFKTRKPTVFAIWNDLFHENVPDEFILKTFQEIGGQFQNTYLILTKRPQRMLDVIERINPILRAESRAPIGPVWNNLCFGLTVCNQAEADEKIPIFLQVPGKKFLSIEPMLGPIDLTKIYNGSFPPFNCLNRWTNGKQSTGVDAVILGGETGPGARPMHLDWVRSVRDQCAEAGVPFFFKGWGKHIPPTQGHNALNGKRNLDGRTHDDLPWHGGGGRRGNEKSK
jgi:protein gp37